MKYILTCAALLLSGVLATPTTLHLLAELAPDTIQNLPTGNKVCNSNTYTSDDIKTRQFRMGCEEGRKAIQ